MTPSRALAALALTLALGACDMSDPSTVGEPSTSPSTSEPTAGQATPTPTVRPTAPRTPFVVALPTDLADGKHYARLKKLDRKAGTLTVDVVQFLTGEEAEQAAQEDGEEAFDYYVRNQNPKLRTLTIGADAKVVTNTLTASESGSSSKDVTITQAKLATFFAKGQAQQRVFWFTLKAGVVVHLNEQYLP